MNKQKRTFVILAIVLAACLAGYLGLLNYNKYKSDDDSESESDSVEALSLDSSDVKSLSFLIDGQEYSFSRIKSEDTSMRLSQRSLRKQIPIPKAVQTMMTSGSAIMTPLLKSIQARLHHCLETLQASQLQRNLIQMRIHLILDWMSHRMS